MGNGCISSMPKNHRWTTCSQKRNHLFQRMCQLMQCITESTFSVTCEELGVEYADKPSVWQYIRGRWCGLTYVWRKLWPKFGRMFNYGHVDTTNIVERHWQLIKYTTLRGRINDPLPILCMS